MMNIRSFSRLLPFAAFVAVACSGDPAADASRDLTLPPAEAVAAINDNPENEPADAPVAQAPAPPATRPATRPATPPATGPSAAPRPPAAPTVAAGTGFLAFAADTLTSRHNNEGDPVMATVGEDMLDARGRVVIPIGAVLVGTVTDMAPAETPGGQGRMVLTFTQVSFDGQSYDIELSTDSMQTHMKGRGVTTGDAAKVGAGAVVGAIAGRVIGGNRTGTAVGAAAGAAAGVGIAAATRDVDIILDAGAGIFLTLAADFRMVAR